MAKIKHLNQGILKQLKSKKIIVLEERVISGFNATGNFFNDVLFTLEYNCSSFQHNKAFVIDLAKNGNPATDL